MWNRANSSGGGQTKMLPAAQGPPGRSSIGQGQGDSISHVCAHSSHTRETEPPSLPCQASACLAPVLPQAGTIR